MTQRYHRALCPVFHIAVLGIVLVDAFMSIQKQTKGGRPREEIGRRRRRRPPFLPLLLFDTPFQRRLVLFNNVQTWPCGGPSTVRVDGRVHFSDAVD